MITNALKQLNSSSSELREWLFTQALPVWWQIGGDKRQGGFVEQVTLQGDIVDVPRRTRLVGRQIYVYAVAAELGWEGPTHAIVNHGLDFLLNRCLSPAGTFHSSVTPDGSPVNSRFDLYDQAFALFSLAAAARVHTQPEILRELARRVLVAVNSAWKHPIAGYEESVPRTLPLKSNPHMHLLEAALAWIETDGAAADGEWHRVADDIAELCLKRFLHPINGSLREYFDGNWLAMPDDSGRIIEPGHQFEWAWLLKRWGDLRGRSDSHDASRVLVHQAERHGVDKQRGVAVNELWDDFSIKDANARLWPQTERIKAWLAVSTLARSTSERAEALAMASEATRGLMKYFVEPYNGLWRETMQKDSSFESAPVRASSLYHIVCAYEQINRHLQALGR